VDKAILNLKKAAKLIFLPGFDGELFCMELNAIVEAYGDFQNMAVATQIFESHIKPKAGNDDEIISKLEKYHMISLKMPQKSRNDYIVIDNDGKKYLRIVRADDNYKHFSSQHITYSYQQIKDYQFMVLSKKCTDDLENIIW